jgi:hypothetical protein
MGERRDSDRPGAHKGQKQSPARAPEKFKALFTQRRREKAPPDVIKNVRLCETFGSPEFYASMGVFYGKLEELRSKEAIRSHPHEVMTVLDAFQQQSVLPARVYEGHFAILPEEDRRIVDRLLREERVVEATVVFRDKRFADADIVPGEEYSNADLLDRVLKPRSPLSIDLIDPAVYASTVPGESLADLFDTSSSVKSALIGTLWAASEHPESERATEERDRAMKRYEERSQDAREWDARTLASLISRYASHEEPRISALAIKLTTGFISLFNGPKDLPALVFLKEQLEITAAQPGASSALRDLVTRLNEAITIKRRGPEAGKQKTKADHFVMGFKGWKTHR